MEDIKVDPIRLKSKGIEVLAYAVVATLLIAGCLHCPQEVKMSRHSARASGVKMKLIYDGDIGPDPCDFSTLSMLHEYHNKGMIELLGVMGATPDPYLASTFSIYNQVYGNDILIGSFNNAPGGVDFIIEGALDALPAQYQDRKTMVHTPTITLVRTSAEEMAAVARLIAERLAESAGPTAMILPLRAFGWFAREGQPLHDPESDQVFIETFKAHAPAQVRIVEMDTHLNDPHVGELAVQLMTEMLDQDNSLG